MSLGGAIRDLRGWATNVETSHAAIVALAYYVGARIGFAFQAPDAPQSVMWLPNSILLAALLLSPPRRWPVFLIAGLPAHLLVAWSANAPMPTMAMLYLTNCADAALGAFGVRLLSRGPWQLKDLRGFIVFIGVAAIGAPLFVSFLDAGITVLTGWGDNFWLAYGRRVTANSLTNVILVPAIVGTVAMTWPRRDRKRRIAEAAVCIAVVAIVSSIAFAHRTVLGVGSWIYVPLPFLLWPAVRLGPGITGVALMAVAFISSWHALRGGGVFSGASPVERVAALQSLLFGISVPVLSLAMVVLEREAAMFEVIQSRNAIRLGVDTVRDLAGRLIAGQEAERAHVARELHDDVGQYVANVAITVSALRRAAAAQSPGLDDRFKKLYDDTSMLFERIRQVSHRLHPTVIQHAGLVAAIHELCEESARQYALQVRFEQKMHRQLSEEAALGAYRIAQEALRNAATHARARVVKVRLSSDHTGVTLTVADDGRGFDVVAAHTRQGLGLASMEERARLLDGHLMIDSDARGSRITAFIPWPAEASAS